MSTESTEACEELAQPAGGHKQNNMFATFPALLIEVATRNRSKAFGGCSAVVVLSGTESITHEPIIGVVVAAKALR